MISPNNQNGIQASPFATNIMTVRGGREGALSYPLQAGYTALLLDEENQMFFIKRNDGSGMQLPLREFKFKEVTPSNSNPGDGTQYATKEDFNILMAEIKKLQGNTQNNFKPRRNNSGQQHYAKPDVR